MKALLDSLVCVMLHVHWASRTHSHTREAHGVAYAFGPQQDKAKEGCNVPYLCAVLILLVCSCYVCAHDYDSCALGQPHREPQVALHMYMVGGTMGEGACMGRVCAGWRAEGQSGPTQCHALSLSAGASLGERLCTHYCMQAIDEPMQCAIRSKEPGGTMCPTFCVQNVRIRCERAAGLDG